MDGSVFFKGTGEELVETLARHGMGEWRQVAPGVLVQMEDCYGCGEKGGTSRPGFVDGFGECPDCDGSGKVWPDGVTDLIAARITEAYPGGDPAEHRFVAELAVAALEGWAAVVAALEGRE